MNLLSFSLIYTFISIYTYYKYRNNDESEESLGFNYYSIVNEKKYYLFITSWFQHNSVNYLILDCLSLFIVDLTGDRLYGSTISRRIASIVITTLLLYSLLFIYTYFRSMQQPGQYLENLKSYRYYGLYYFGIGVTVITSLNSSVKTGIGFIMLFLYIRGETRFFPILLPSAVLGLCCPFFPNLFSTFWMYTLSGLFLLICFLSFISDQNSSVLPTTDHQEPSHFEVFRHLQPIERQEPAWLQDRY